MPTLVGALVETPRGRGQVMSDLSGQTLPREAWKVWVRLAGARGDIASFPYNDVTPVRREEPRDLAALALSVEGPFEHGGDDYEPATDHCYYVVAEDQDGEVGRLTVDAEPEKGSLHVRFVEVDPACRRQGVATLLVRHALKAWPGRNLKTNGFTDDGHLFWDSRPWRAS